MKKVIVIFVVILALMEGVSWWAYQSASRPVPASVNVSEQGQQTSLENTSGVDEEKSVPPEASLSGPISEWTGSDFEGFPSPSTEVVNGRTERTIHMGVRQYVWEPAVITAKKGERVRLIIHNADVKHGLVIPGLGVNEDIPPDGAVVEFIASQAGTFEFFCSVWCGEGHMEMRGKLVIE